MTIYDALEFERPIIGFLNRKTIKGFGERVPKTASGAPSKAKGAAKKWAEAFAYLDAQSYGGVRLKDGTYVPNKKRAKRGGNAILLSNAAAVKKAKKEKGARTLQGMQDLRSTRGSAWRRAPAFYGRSGKAKGKPYYKGQRKKDYEQSWSPDAAAWQSGAGEQLRVKFRKGRGVVLRRPVYLGFGPGEDEVDEINLGGFGGPIDEPGGVVKLNRGRRRTSRGGRKARRKKNPTRNKKGHFVKKRRNPKKKARRREARRNPRAKKAKAYNNPRRRRRKRKNPARKRN